MKSSEGKGIKEKINFDELKKEFYLEFGRADGCIDEEIDEVWDWLLIRIKDKTQKAYWSGIDVMKKEIDKNIINPKDIYVELCQKCGSNHKTKNCVKFNHPTHH